MRNDSLIAVDLTYKIFSILGARMHSHIVNYKIPPLRLHCGLNWEKRSWWGNLE